MIAEKIEGCVAELRTLAGQVIEPQWELIKCVTAELNDAARAVQNMERTLLVPLAPEDVAAEQKLWADAGAARRAERAQTRGVAHA